MKRAERGRGDISQYPIAERLPARHIAVGLGLPNFMLGRARREGELA
jgi:hypothetical protein